MRALALALLVVGCTGDNPARREIELRRAAAPAVAEGFTCPMHPEVHADQAGSCPTCGMPLVAQER